MTKCKECEVIMTPLTNSSKAGGCCVDCEDKGLHKKHIKKGKLLQLPGRYSEKRIFPHLKEILADAKKKIDW